MGKGAPLRWLENRILRRQLRGIGIEVGALWRRALVAEGARVFQLDRMVPCALKSHYSDIGTAIIAPDVIADATELPCAPGSLDFLIASHVLEHLPFPLRALRRWCEVLRPAGVLLLRVPDKRYTFDRRRERTPLLHLISEDEQPQSFDRRAHFADWVEKVVGRSPREPAFERDLEQLLAMDYSIHYHVWTSEDVRNIFSYLEETSRINCKLELFWKAHFYRKETIALLRKQ